MVYVRRDERTTRLARGLAVVARRRPLPTPDPFRMGTLPKPFVAPVRAGLVTESKLSLDDSVESLLPGLVPGGESITIRQLLNHTSGIYDYEKDPRVLKPYLDGNLRYKWEPRDLVDIAASHRPLFKPGKRYDYSNTNYLIAGLAIEAVTGSPLPEQMQQRVFRPLALGRTALQLSPKRDVPDVHGYLTLGRPPATDITGLSPYPWAAGAITSTIDEVARYYRALLGGRLVDPVMLRTMKTSVPEGPESDGFPGRRSGLGIESFPTRCGTAWGHSGNFPGYLVYALTSANGKRQAILVVNQDPGSLPKSFGPMFIERLKRAYCGRE